MKKLVLVMVFSLMLMSCGGKEQVDPASVPGATGVVHDVLIVNYEFIPSTLAINKGDAVKWTNKDNAAHTATEDNDAWDSDRLENGDQWTHVFTETGENSYYCAIHPSMKGSITVQ